MPERPGRLSPQLEATEFVKNRVISLKDSPDLNEDWVQKRIVDDPAILGLGEDVVVRDRERRHPGAGRLDILLENSEDDTRYEVEIQLGSTNESHIILSLIHI